MKRLKKPHRGKQLLIFLLVFIVIVVVYVLAVSLTDRQDEQLSLEKRLQVAELNVNAVTALSWEYQGESIALSYMANAWRVTEATDFPLQQMLVEEMLETLTRVVALDSLNASQPLAEYGLETPPLTIITTVDGLEEQRFSLSPVPEQEGNYYLRHNNSSVVYVVDGAIWQAFSKQLYDLVENEPAPEYAELRSMWVNGGSQQLNVVRSNNGASRTYSSKFHWFIQNDDGTFSAVDNELTEQLIASVLEVEPRRCVDYHADEAEMAAYGLTAPRLSIVVSYVAEEGQSVAGAAANSQQMVLKIGAAQGEEDYACLEGSNMVYLIPNSLTQTLLNASYQTLLPDDVLLMDWDTVTEMEIAMSGSGHRLVFNRGDSVSYTLDGAAVDGAAVENFLASLDALRSVGRSDLGSQQGIEVGIVFHRTHEDYRTMNFYLYPYDDNSDLLSFNGRNDLLVERAGIEQVKEAFAAVVGSRQ